MDHFELVGLTRLMERTEGWPETVIAVIDGPLVRGQPAFSGQRIREIESSSPAACRYTNSFACIHGTFIMGMLAAKRGSGAPAICPGCTFLVRPIFSELSGGNGEGPSAPPEELAAAIIDTINAGARIINLSAALGQSSSRGEVQLTEALDYAVKRGVIIVAAAGNQGTVGSSIITRHRFVIPVVASDSSGRPVAQSNLGSSIGRQGLSAPGENITSLGAQGALETFGGTSAAAPFVTGAIALLWSEFPFASATIIKWAIAGAGPQRRRTIAPPLLDAWAAYQALASDRHGRRHYERKQSEY